MGDAFNMRHPLIGGGMTIAMSNIVLLCNLLKPLQDLGDASSLCKYLESFYTLRKHVASTINTLAGALYKVFSTSPDQARNEMRQACFDYLSLGGSYSTGPIALLSSLNPHPLNLVAHLFAVAIFGVGRLMLPYPSAKRLWIGARLITIIRALNLYRKKTGTNNVFWIHLDKKVPTGAGLGGGSSNAATALWTANQFSGHLVTEKELQQWSGEIGSDIPFFFSNRATYCSGRGEVVQDLPHALPSDLLMDLIKPPEASSTAESV